MADGKIVSLSDYRQDGAQLRSPGPIDFWELVTTGVTADGALRLGETSLAEVVQLCGAPDDMQLDDRGVDDIGIWEHQEFTWHFGRNGRFEGLYFGATSADEILRIVESAISLHDHNGTPIPRPPGVDILLDDRVPVRLRGRQLHDFAALPDALGVMHEIAPSSVKSRTSDKWISLSYAAPFGLLTAGFLLKAFKMPYLPQFHVDYCLHAIGVSHAREIVREERVALPSGGEP